LRKKSFQVLRESTEGGIATEQQANPISGVQDFQIYGVNGKSVREMPEKGSTKKAQEKNINAKAGIDPGMNLSEDLHPIKKRPGLFLLQSLSQRILMSK